MRGRRGNQAIEFAICTPILLTLLAGIIDLGQYMYVADGLINSVAQGGRQGALANPVESEDPALVASSITNASWLASELPGAITLTSSVTGTEPDAMIVIQGVVPFTAFFGFVTLPPSISYTHTVRLMHQPEP